MADGLLGMLGGGQQQAQQGNMLGGLFQSESQARRQGRNRLLGQALQIAQQQDPVRSGFALAGGLLGQGIARSMGRVTPEEARQQKFAGLQQQLMSEGLDPTQDPAGFYNRTSELLYEMGETGPALQAAARARELAPEPQELPAGFRNLALRAQAAGLTPGTREYAEFMRAGGQQEEAGTNVTIEGDTGPQVGTIPSGYQLREENGAYRLEPIPGGPAAAEMEAAEEQAERKEELKERAAKVVFEDIQRLQELVANDSVLSPVLGLQGQLMSGIPGSTRADAEQLTETIKANIGFDRLQQMREASPTGGALGQVSNREIQSLQAVLSSVSLSQSQEQLERNLRRLKDIYGNILRKLSAYPNAEEFGFDNPPEGLNEPLGGSKDFSDMSANDILEVNIDNLSENELSEYNKALEALLQGEQ